MLGDTCAFLKCPIKELCFSNDVTQDELQSSLINNALKQNVYKELETFELDHLGM